MLPNAIVNPFDRQSCAEKSRLAAAFSTSYVIYDPFAISLLLLHSCEALAAVYGSVAGGLERNLCFLAALSAHGGVHLSLCSGSVLSCVTASLASLGLVLEAFFSIELLLTCSENEFLSAILAN